MSLTITGMIAVMISASVATVSVTSTRPTVSRPCGPATTERQVPSTGDAVSKRSFNQSTLDVAGDGSSGRHSEPPRQQDDGNERRGTDRNRWNASRQPRATSPGRLQKRRQSQGVHIGTLTTPTGVSAPRCLHAGGPRLAILQGCATPRELGGQEEV